MGGGGEDLYCGMYTCFSEVSESGLEEGYFEAMRATSMRSVVLGSGSID